MPAAIPRTYHPVPDLCAASLPDKRVLMRTKFQMFSKRGVLNPGDRFLTSRRGGEELLERNEAEVDGVRLAFRLLKEAGVNRINSTDLDKDMIREAEAEGMKASRHRYLTRAEKAADKEVSETGD